MYNVEVRLSKGLYENVEGDLLSEISTAVATILRAKHGGVTAELLVCGVLSSIGKRNEPPSKGIYLDDIDRLVVHITKYDTPKGATIQVTPWLLNAAARRIKAIAPSCKLDLRYHSRCFYGRSYEP